MIPDKEELALTIDMAEWGWLRAHLERDGLILIAADMDLAEAGWRIATDDADTVGGWIASGKIGKPSAAQIAAWDGDKGRQFQMLIVSPYILIQDKALHIQ
ncbi:DUF2288 domain-containing protein [Geotalea sp. SG265]|uniref:DUF2288 domain-containing protein n=1 Tax=Geotalea sp. SG265 TaxID=2922867 RepID=UPI001FAF0D56